MKRTDSSKRLIHSLLKQADVHVFETFTGNAVENARPWDIIVHHPQFYKRCIAQGSLGLGEAYMDGWFDVEAIDELVHKIIQAELHKKFKFNLSSIKIFAEALLFNRQSLKRAKQVGEEHYDIDPELYKAMLGEDEIYTCAYWKGLERKPENLILAQQQKLNLVFNKLKVQKGMSVLDVGCGWGGTLIYGHKNFGITGTGISISKEQVQYAQNMAESGGYPLEFRLQDYRHVHGKFDRALSIGMFEHVGKKNYRSYMKSVHTVLDDQGLFLLHCIGGFDSSSTEDPWLDKYIFPNSVLPSLADIAKASEGYFIIHDVQNFGIYYDTTLVEWNTRFETYWKSHEDVQKKYGTRFYRMWRYYLLMCAGTFRARKNQLYQVVLSKPTYTGEYIGDR
jgi:cyclopropane-fatty-acyl-phospholipid synthase